MGVKSVFSNLFKPVDDDYDDRDYLPRESYEPRNEAYRSADSAGQREPAPDRTYTGATAGGYMPRQTGAASSPVSPLAGVQRHPVAVTTTLDVVRIEPRDFRRDSCTIVDAIRQGCAIVVNTEHTGEELARRILDFISGGAYALDAQPEKVGEKVYLITPKNVRLLDDPASVIESSEDRF